MVYQQKPDICFIDTLKKIVILFELTVPFETNIDAAHQRKEDRYAGLTHDVEKAGWKCTLICVEIGSRGLITPQNKVRMKEMLKLCNSKIKYPHMREEILLKTVLFGSYVIFNGKSEPSWQIDQFLNIIVFSSSLFFCMSFWFCSQGKSQGYSYITSLI